MDKLLNVFMESNGQLSFIRVIGLIFAVSYIVQWQASVWGNAEPPSWNDFAATMSALGFKIIQKPFEKDK